MKITKRHIVGYSLMLTGIILCVLNYAINCKGDANFGFVPLYIFSGVVSAFGLTFVFSEKIDGKVENVETNNT